MGAGGRRFRAAFWSAAAVLSLLAAESERAPVLVLVDDLQWVDRESAAALGVRGSSPPRRPGLFPVGGAKWLDPAPVRGRDMPVLTLAGLSPTDARALVPERLADGVVERLVDDTGGNPLGILEIARRLTDAQRVGAAPLPDALPRRRPPWSRVLPSSSPACPRRPGGRCCCPPSTARVPRPRWPRRWPGKGSTWPPRWTRPRTSGMLVRHGAELGFRHPLLRTAALARATSAQQRSAHRALAEVLAADPDSLAGTWHRAEAAAGPDHQLAQDLVRAADQSRTRQGYAAASAAMERAALLTDDRALVADWLATAAADAFLAGDADRTRSLVARVLSGSGPPRAQGRALFTLGMLEEYAGSVPHSVELLASAAERLDGAHRTRALAELALARFRLNDVAGCQRMCRQHPSRPPTATTPKQRMLADFTRGSPPPSAATWPPRGCCSMTSSN